MTDFCSICGGELLVLGTLGNREHSRCRDCGIDQSLAIPTVPCQNETRRASSSAKEAR